MVFSNERVRGTATKGSDPIDLWPLGNAVVELSQKASSTEFVERKLHLKRTGHFVYENEQQERERERGELYPPRSMCFCRSSIDQCAVEGVSRCR